MRYDYKKLDYAQAHARWESRNAKALEEVKRLYDLCESLDKEGNTLAATEAENKAFRLERKIRKHEPHEEVETLYPGRVYIDICRGISPMKLLLRCEHVRKIPYTQIRDILLSNKARHVHRGPYEHKLTINVYPSNVRCWYKTYTTMEVDLWQEVIVEDVIRDVEEAVKEAHTCVLITRTYRY